MHHPSYLPRVPLKASLNPGRETPSRPMPMPDAPGRRRAILDELCGTERENGTSLWYGSVDNADRSAPNARLYLSMGFIAHTMTCSFPRTLERRRLQANARPERESGRSCGKGEFFPFSGWLSCKGEYPVYRTLSPCANTPLSHGRENGGATPSAPPLVFWDAHPLPRPP